MCGGCSLTSAALWRAGHVPVRDLLSPESRVTSLHKEQNIQHWQQQWQCVSTQRGYKLKFHIARCCETLCYCCYMLHCKQEVVVCRVYC